MFYVRAGEQHWWRCPRVPEQVRLRLHVHDVSKLKTEILKTLFLCLHVDEENRDDSRNVKCLFVFDVMQRAALLFT